MLALLVHGHLGALELVELAADGGLVARRQPGPRLVRAPVVVVSLDNGIIINKQSRNRGRPVTRVGRS